MSVTELRHASARAILRYSSRPAGSVYSHSPAQIFRHDAGHHAALDLVGPAVDGPCDQQKIFRGRLRLGERGLDIAEIHDAEAEALQVGRLCEGAEAIGLSGAEGVLGFGDNPVESRPSISAASARNSRSISANSFRPRPDA